MSDLISRQAAIDALICKMRPHNNGDGTMTICVMSEGLVRETLNDLPSAEPERKKGHWVYYDEYAEAVTHKCSECGKRMTTAIGVKASFCWNCGADMRGEQE